MTALILRTPRTPQRTLYAFSGIIRIFDNCMKQLFTLAITLMLSSACQSFEPFTFVQMSDTQIGFIDTSPRFAHSDSLMKAAVDAANDLSPAYVFVTGDLVDNPADPVQDSVFRTRLAELRMPVYTGVKTKDTYCRR